MARKSSWVNVTERMARLPHRWNSSARSILCGKAARAIVSNYTATSITHGMRVAYADFDVVFRHAVQGIHGPPKDRGVLIFLAAYLRSPLARYFLFHTSSNWGVSRSKVHLEELLELPFPLPEQTARPGRAAEIVAAVEARVRQAMSRAKDPFTDRQSIVRETQSAVEPLLFEYFDLDDVEQVLVQDTNKVIIPSIRPSRASDRIP